MDQAANRLYEITHDTLDCRVSDESVKSHVEIRQCTRRSCQRAAEDDSEFCGRHEADQRRYNREYMARRRADWDAAGKCTGCGADRRKRGSRWCAGCVIRYNKSSVKSQVEINAGKRLTPWSRSQRIAAATTLDKGSDGYSRERYHGTGKRGAPSMEDRDRRDLADIQRVLHRYGESLDEAYSRDYVHMSKVQQEATRRAAHAGLALAIRLGIEALSTYGYKVSAVLEDDEDDE